MPILFPGDHGPADTLRFMEEKTGAGLWSLDLRTSRMEWSGGMYVLLGLEAEGVEPSYALINSLAHPDDRSVLREIDRLVHEGVPFDRVFRIIRQNGRLRWLLNRGETLFNADGHPERAIGMMQDVTGHRDAIESLRNCGERYRSLVMAANAMVWTARPDGQVTDLSQPAGPNSAALVQYTGDRWKELVHSDDLPATLAAWSSAVSAQVPYECEHRLRVPDGSYRWHRSRAMPIMKAGNTVQEWVGISIDIHEQKIWPAGRGKSDALTGFQIRAGRGMLKWSVRDLAEKARTSPGIIRRLEDTDGPLDPSDVAVQAIHEAFTQAGVEFLFPPSGKPAVRLS
jgi:PAS domain S-box-containing protein